MYVDYRVDVDDSSDCEDPLGRVTFSGTASLESATPGYVVIEGVPVPLSGSSPLAQQPPDDGGTTTRRTVVSITASGVLAASGRYIWRGPGFPQVLRAFHGERSPEGVRVGEPRDAAVPEARLNASATPTRRGLPRGR